MSDIAIRAEGISKSYKLGAKAGSYKTLRDSISGLFSRRQQQRQAKDDILWALRDVSFEIKQGEVVGIIGRNGAGKSTLLKILSRITEPTRGYAEIHGRIGSLLEVGTGFHPELSGRENIYLNGAILGMRRAEIDAKFDDIIAFAEVERFLDTPVKHYSSGMYLRLAFAVAAHLEPDILLVDEVLAVGDVAFQKKCTGKMNEVAKEGRTVLFVSHNMAAMQQLCTNGFLLTAGGVTASGPIDQVIRTYLASTMPAGNADLLAVRERKGAGEVRFRTLRFEDEFGQETMGLVCGEAGRIVLGLQCERPATKVRVCIGFLDNLNQKLMYLDSRFVGEELTEVPPNGEVVCDIPRVHLAPGRYRLEIWIQTSSSFEQDRIGDAGYCDVLDGNFFGTGRSVAPGFQVALMDYQWSAQARREEREAAEKVVPSHGR